MLLPESSAIAVSGAGEGGDTKNSRDRKPSRSRNGNRNGRDKKSDNGGKSSNRKRVSFEDEFEKRTLGYFLFPVNLVGFVGSVVT